MTPSVEWLELLVEEPSMEAFLNVVVPRIVPDLAFVVRSLGNKDALLRNLPNRFAGYAATPGLDLRVVVLVDRDDDDCHALKEQIVAAATGAGLSVDSANSSGIVLPRVVVEELEAWYIGDVAALTTAFPGVPASLGNRAVFRDPDAVRGGTWEALQRVLRTAGHYPGGLRKIDCAERVARHLDIETNRSASFAAFRDGLRRLTGMN